MSTSGCDAIAVLSSEDVAIIELKSGRLGRDDAEDSVEQIKKCMLFCETMKVNVSVAVVYYG